MNGVRVGTSKRYVHRGRGRAVTVVEEWDTPKAPAATPAAPAKKRAKVIALFGALDQSAQGSPDGQQGAGAVTSPKRF
jgi:hypothetical protein